MNGVKKILAYASRRLAAGRLLPARSPLTARSAAASAVVGFVSASARHQAVLDEISAAATTALELHDGKAPEWITLMPKGTFTLIDGRGPFNNLDPAAIVAASLQRAGNTELPGDYDHHMDLPPEAGVKGLAAAWVKELKVDGGAIRARIDWTSAGRQHVEAKEYRYVSPRFAADADGNVLFLVRFALTNKPAITDLPAIAAHATQHPPKENDVNLLQRLIGALAISASATEDQVIDLVRSLFDKANTITRAAGLTSAAAADDVISALRQVDATKFVSAADHQKVVDELTGLKTQVSNANTARLTAEISAAVEKGIGAGQIVPAQKDFWTAACTSAGSIGPVTDFLKTAPVVLMPTGQGGGRPPIAGGEISAAAVEADPALMSLCREHNITPARFAETRNAEIRMQRDRAAAAAA